MTDPLPFRGAADLAGDLRARKLSAVDLTGAFLDRIERLDPYYHSFISLSAESAMADADRADRELRAGIDRGPMHGIPVGIKDLIDTAGIVTAAGLAVRAGHVPDRDATVVRRLREGGAVILGKLTLTEGATLLHHPDTPVPVNPWGATRNSGFSSSGAGVAVAAGLCTLALASDTGGSIRIPSAFNGLTGLKPSWGRVSRAGVFPLAECLDVVGPMARSAADAAIALSVIAGADPDDPTTDLSQPPDYAAGLRLPIDGVVIGVDWERIATDCTPSVMQGLRAIAATLKTLGAIIAPVRLDLPDPQRIVALAAAGISDAHRETFPAFADQYSPAIRAMLEAGMKLPARDVAAAMSAAERFKGQLRASFAHVDLLLVPAMTGPAPSILGSGIEGADSVPHSMTYTLPFNVSGSPTITFPCGFDGGLPIAGQLIGPHLAESLLLRAAHAFQSRTEWHRHRPPAPR
ncbi:amidase [Sphingomonas flavalba]|uniref:amidase n=1 Tax=Sphingomonas flavalba TaxID=2559804 RepID=UPI0039E03847